MNSGKRTRRDFFGSGAGLGLAGAAAASSGAAEDPLPKVRLGNRQVTRLISGNNQFYGFAHFNWLLDAHMKEWSTPERVCGVMRQYEQSGINTTLVSYRDRTFADIKRHWAEGGKLQWILLLQPKDAALLPELSRLNPAGIAHHGEATDRMFRDGEMAKVREFLKAVRDTGAPVGLSMHNPRVLEYAEEHDWDLDFYMTCLYHRTRTPEEFRKLLGGELPLGEIYLREDPERMCRVIRQTRKTCVTFKILAAGRRISSSQEVEQCFRFAFENIKRQDCVLVGMYPRYKDEVRENAGLVRRFGGSAAEIQKPASGV